MGTTKATLHDLAAFAIFLSMHNLTMSSEDEYIRNTVTNQRVGRIIRVNQYGMPMLDWVIEIVTSVGDDVYEPGCNFLNDLAKNRAATLHTPKVKNHVTLNLAGQALKHCMN